MAVAAPSPTSTEIRRILVTAYGHIADVMPSLAALRALKEVYPQAEITVLAVDYVREMLEACPYVDNVLIMKDFAHKGSRWSKVEQVVRLAQLVPRIYGRFDAVLIMHARTRFLTRLAHLSGARIRAGFEDVAGPGAITHPARPLAAYAAFREENRRVLEAIGVKTMQSALDLHFSAQDDVTVGKLLASSGITEHDLLIGLHPGSHWTCQQWEVDDWAAVADTLVATYGARLVITGTEDEREMADAIIKRMHVQDAVVLNAAGRTSILQFAALIKRMRLLLCVNSAASQVALAMKTRTINLVGYENPVWTAPMHGEPMVILRECDDTTAKTSWCPYNVWGKLSQCHRAECVGIGGLSLIRPQRVLQTVAHEFEGVARSQQVTLTTRHDG